MKEIFLVKNNIVELRAKLDWPQWKLALAAIIAASRLSLLENGAPPRSNEIEKLCKIFQVEPNEIWPHLNDRPEHKDKSDDGMALTLLDKEIWNFTELAEYLGRKPNAKFRYKMAKMGIPYRKILGRVYFLKKEVKAWMEQQAPGLRMDDLAQEESIEKAPGMRDPDTVQYKRKDITYNGLWSPPHIWSEWFPMRPDWWGIARFVQILNFEYRVVGITREE